MSYACVRLVGSCGECPMCKEEERKEKELKKGAEDDG